MRGKLIEIISYVRVFVVAWDSSLAADDVADDDDGLYVFAPACALIACDKSRGAVAYAPIIDVVDK